jgi:hypothetical protein
MGDRGFGNLMERLTEPNGPMTAPTSSSRKQAVPAREEENANTDGKGVAKPATAPVQVIGSVPLHRWERDAFKGYHSLIRTPRGATRLLNTYRLVRAGIPAREWDDFRADEGGTGESRLAMLLLAVAAGQPAVAREWFGYCAIGSPATYLRPMKWRKQIDQLGRTSADCTRKLKNT